MDPLTYRKIQNLSDKDFLCWHCGKKGGGEHAPYNQALPTDECGVCGNWATGGVLCKWKFE